MKQLLLNSKKWVFRIILLAGLILTYIITNFIVYKLEKLYLRPVEILFELPLQKEIQDKYGVEASPEIEKVIIAGFFSEWSPNDDNFKMNPVSSNKWSIQLPLVPGDNQYKFVIYLKGEEPPLWVHDKNARHQVSDAFGGFNSIIKIPNIQQLSFILNIIIIGSILFMLVYFLMDPLLHLILKLKISFRYKLIISMVFLGIFSNIIIISYNLLENREFIKQGIIDSLNLVHNTLLSEGVDFKKLNEPSEKIKIDKSLKKNIWPARIRSEKNKTSNIQITISDILILNKKLDLVCMMNRKENIVLLQDRVKRSGYKTIEEYYLNGYMSKIIEKVKNDKRYNGFMSGIAEKKFIDLESSIFNENVFLLGFNYVLYPIKENNDILGYYAVTIHSWLYGNELMRVLLFNLVLVLVLSNLYFLLLFNIGRVITNNLSLLTQWTKRINEGDFDVVKDIKTNDEIQVLSENFNKMRMSLKESFRQIEEYNNRLRVEAYIDKLTGLPNRKKFFNDLEDLHYNALILINIDSFQEINNFFGNDVGDFILFEMGNRLKSLLLKEDQHLYKIGTDEFIIAFNRKIEKKEIEVFTIYFCDGIMDISYKYGENEIYISVTAGLSLEDYYNGQPPQEQRNILLSKADIALNRAKKSILRHLLYDDTMEIIREYEVNRYWTNKLKESIKDNRILPFFQPIVNNATKIIEKYECLARMKDKDGSILLPEAFLKISKKARFYRFITKIMLDKSLEIFKDKPFEFSINLSIEDIIDVKTHDLIMSRLRHNPLTSERLVFELVETEGIENYDVVKDFISEVKEFGCKIAIDDFGVGYSNFEHLLQLNIDYIKIDASLIKNMDHDINSQVIARTISRFAKDLNIKTISEFVHSREIYEKSLEYGIDYSQGYYFGEPKSTL